MDIIGAMEKEREYLSFRMKGEEPFHLVDAVKEYGFDSLKDYFDAKINYQFSQLRFEVVETTPERAISDVMATIEAKKTAILFAVTNKTIVWNGNQGEYNASYCEECGIPIYPLGTNGGTIVSTPGDLNIGICFPEIKGLDAKYILNGFSEIFKKYTNKIIEVDRNDLLIAGRKILGSSVYKQNGMFVFITPVSLSKKENLICEICLKHSTKQPSHIDFMTADILCQEVEQWLAKSFI